MATDEACQPITCADCMAGAGLDFEFTMAFQPFVNVNDGSIFGYEALVRGADGAGAGEVLARVNDSNRYRFDQACRVKAIELASRLELPGMLSINFMPGAMYKPETCIFATLQDEGVSVFQGYLFAKPGFEHLPQVPPEIIDSVKPRRRSDRRRRR